jgi:hypothetical protein
VTGAGQDALDLLQRISRDGSEAEFEQLGDPLPLPATMEELRESEVARLFGGEFTDALQGLARAGVRDRIAGGVLDHPAHRGLRLNE